MTTKLDVVLARITGIEHYLSMARNLEEGTVEVLAKIEKVEDPEELMRLEEFLDRVLKHELKHKNSSGLHEAIYKLQKRSGFYDSKRTA